jgi:hypothetical protein
MLEAMAWAIGFGFQEANTFGLAWFGLCGLAWLGFGLKPSHAHHYLAPLQ